MTAFFIILGIIVVLAFLVIGIYNRLVQLKQRRSNAFSDIDVQLRQRYDLIPNLIETVKGYASHESDIMKSVTEARSRAMGHGGSVDGSRIADEAQLSTAMMQLMAVSENYPDLKADGRFQDLQDELSEIENKIAAARRFFNSATAELNTSIQQFPAVLFAGAFGFNIEEFFEMPEEVAEAAKEAPKVSFK